MSEKSFEEQYADWCNVVSTRVRDLNANEFIRQADAKIAEQAEIIAKFGVFTKEQDQLKDRRIEELRVKRNALQKRIEELEADLEAMTKAFKDVSGGEKQSPWVSADTPPESRVWVLFYVLGVVTYLYYDWIEGFGLSHQVEYTLAMIPLTVVGVLILFFVIIKGDK